MTKGSELKLRTFDVSKNRPRASSLLLKSNHLRGSTYLSSSFTISISMIFNVHQIDGNGH